MNLKAFYPQDTNSGISLEELLQLIPGYVNLCVNTSSECWYFSAGSICKQPKEVREATVLKLIPIQPYVFEVTIERRTKQ